MSDEFTSKRLEIVLRDGKPVAVILNIDEYQEMLERLEDMEELKILQEMRKKPLQFRKIEHIMELRNAQVD